MDLRPFRRWPEGPRPRPVRCVVVEGGVVTMTSSTRIPGGLLVAEGDKLPPIGARVVDGVAWWARPDRDAWSAARLGEAGRRPVGSRPRGWLPAFEPAVFENEPLSAF